jgi:adenylyltransferase/sulfurtransferase
LVSGSAIGTEGQLTVYNWQDGPCYRCLYPKPNATAGCSTCSDNGVLGPVPGLVGVLQAVETIKILTGIGETMHDRLLMYDSLQCSFLSVKKPRKQTKCPVCGPEATIKSMEDSRNSLQAARGPTGVVDNGKHISLNVPPPLPDELIVTCREYSKVRNEVEPHFLLDVRVKKQYDMCALDGAVNIPLARLQDELDEIERLSDGTRPVYCICRRGIFSVEAAKILLTAAETTHPRIHSVRNIAGGLTAWHEEVDDSFPKY